MMLFDRLVDEKSTGDLKDANLTTEERHNRQVDRNNEEWEKSLLTKSYSIFVLFVIMFG